MQIDALRTRSAALVVLVAMLFHLSARAAPDEDLAAFSLEELSRLRISSVAKKPESLATSAASVFVIRNEDIRRLGATTLPEALRLAPNLQFARIDAHSWAISARGFNSRTANKLLVLIDGRPVYTPLYSGVFWDVQDVYMPDVERIEVISGPNAATWGGNAVNGVINVVTRSAHATRGAHASLAGGERMQRYQGRYGASAGDDLAYRVYAKYRQDGDTEDITGAARTDATAHAQAGFRLDAERDRDIVSLQGDVYDGEWDQPMAGNAELGGANLLLQWDRRLANDSRLDMTAFYDVTERLQPGTIEERLQTLGLEVRHHLGHWESHSMLWGVELRHAADDVTNFDALAFIPADKNMSWASVFLRDEFRIAKSVRAMLGLRAERNTFTGFEIMPDVRMAWTPTAGHTLWTSLSRAVRTPSRIDTEFFIPAEPPYAISTSHDFRSETARVLELGYRGQLNENFYYSMTAFHHDFDRLRSLEVLPDNSIMLGNQLQGTTSGLESWLSFQATEAWRLSAGMTYMERDLELRPESTAVPPVTSEGNDAELQWQLRSSLDITAQQELDIFVTHVDDLPNPPLPAYTLVDVNWSWTNMRGFRVSLHAHNLLDREHVEFGDPPDQSVFGRNVFLRLAWSFD